MLLQASMFMSFNVFVYAFALDIKSGIIESQSTVMFRFGRY